MKRLALFLDGTWNDLKDRTNVWKLADALSGKAQGVHDQVSVYLPGVGVKWGEKLSGGALGKGLFRNVSEAYRWLVDNYEDDDEIYLFGFSRGAYTARSVAGVIIRCGLVRPGSALSCDDVLERYHLGRSKPQYHEIKFSVEHPNDPGAIRPTAEDLLLLKSSRRVRIRFIGVWDTVGSLGIPWTSAPFIGRGKYYFHNTNLSTLIHAAYQALAIDENRAPYKPTLWNQYIKQGDPAKPMPGRDRVEQRWFPGAHANVGGGYGPKDLISSVPLAWMQRRAMDHGLQFHRILAADPGALSCAPRDSFNEFMWGVYKIVRFGTRFYRHIGRGPYPVNGGTAIPINEVIDASVFERWRFSPDYRPKALQDRLADWIDPATHQGDLDL